MRVGRNMIGPDKEAVMEEARKTAARLGDEWKAELITGDPVKAGNKIKIKPIYRALFISPCRRWKIYTRKNNFLAALGDGKKFIWRMTGETPEEAMENTRALAKEEMKRLENILDGA